jgi:large subunit ribosomal protein L31
MRDGIHPEYKAAKVTCICGNVIETRSTRGDFEVQICSGCHPFFTGKQKFVDTAGRVERFQRRYGNVGINRDEAAAAPADAPAETAASSPEPAATTQE